MRAHGRTLALQVTAILLLAAALRTVWLTADPPPAASVGIVWHDEGAWTHSARNKALWHTWRTDEWNPVFVAPVFTALEYGAFRLLGVGTWQARTVSVVTGLLAVSLLIIGLGTLGGPRTAVIGGLLLAANYPFVMWNRTAMMETTMAACMVGAWTALVLAERRPVWAVAAGALAVVAWFTKAAAAFFLAALVVTVMMTLWSGWRESSTRQRNARIAWWTLAGLAVTAMAIAGLFVLPHWADYRFYNWEMSVMRKPVYTWRALMDRATWLPLAHDIFTRSWPMLVAASLGLVGIVVRWAVSTPAERLLVCWVALGLAELVVHDSGNARRYIMFLPAFAALAAMALGRTAAPMPARARLVSRWIVVPAVAVLAYLICGSALRLLLHTSVDAGDFRAAVRLSGVMALAVSASVLLRWPATARVVGSMRTPSWFVGTIVAAAVLLDLSAFAAFARDRQHRNYDASVALGRLLPPGTLVQGKLANGMALENRIRPVFVGNGFGNYDDRLTRDDIRYVLTYDEPRLGYESSDGSGLIAGILEQYPGRAIIATFDVDETPAPDRAVLIDKFAGTQASSR